MKQLLSRPAAPILADIVRVLAAASEVVPLSRAHQNDLPFAVRDLSRLLTAERGDLHRPYWAAPRFLAAYVHYFLPWNLYRLAWLLPGLPLLPAYTFSDGAFPAQGEQGPSKNRGGQGNHRRRNVQGRHEDYGRSEPAGRIEPLRILDLGSGPLTLPLALWCSRPDLRNMPLHFVCTDTAIQPLRVGLNLLKALWGDTPVWRADVIKESLDGILSHGGEAFDCILSGNVLNELPPPRDGQPSAGRLEGILRRMRRRMRPGGRVFFLEPGTRLGGKMIALARKGGLANGFRPLAPCTHAGPCPALPPESDADFSPEFAPDLTPALPEELRQPSRSGPMPRGRSQAAGAFSGWCHFVHPVMRDVPEDLLRLTAHARLEKNRFSLSCLLLESPFAPAASENTPQGASSAVAGGGTANRTYAGGQAVPALAPGAPSNPAPGVFSDDDLGEELAELEALYQEMTAEDRDRPPAGGERGGRERPDHRRAGPLKRPPKAGARFDNEAAPAIPHNGAVPAAARNDSAGAVQGAGRVISQPIALPQEREPARYLCTPWGLGLLLDAAPYYSGVSVPLSLPAEVSRDRRTGAIILRS